MENKEKIVIVDSSKEIMEKKNEKAGKNSIYPWQTLIVGRSFIIPPEAGKKYSSIVNLAYRTGKRLGKKFRVMDHGQHGIEVARVENERPIDVEKFKQLTGYVPDYYEAEEKK